MPSKRRIFTLDDYSAHIVPEVDELLFKKGYFLIIFGGGITGELQVDNTSYHQLKANYRKKEMQLMIEMLETNPGKIPAPGRDQMELFQLAWNETCEKVDNEQTFKT